MRDFNLTRLVKDMVDEGPRAQKERDISAELEERTGIPAGQGMLVPISAINSEKREITYSGSGDELVNEEHLDSDFIDILRNRSHVMSMGPTILDNLKGDVHIPRKTGSAATGWISGDAKTSSLTANDITFDSLALSPKFVGVLTEFSYRVSIQSEPAIEEIARQDMADSIATELDRVAIEGGDTNEPTGINRQSGINEQTFSGSGPTWAQVLSSVEKVLDNGVVINNGGFIADTGMYSYFKSTDKGSDTGQFLVTDDTLDNHPIKFSNNMPTDHALFGNWADLVVAHWGVLRILVNPYEHFDSGSVQIRAILPVDLGVRHAESFTNIRKTTS